MAITTSLSLLIMNSFSFKQGGELKFFLFYFVYIRCSPASSKEKRRERAGCNGIGDSCSIRVNLCVIY